MKQHGIIGHQKLTKTGLKGKDLFMPLRLILTGKSHGPELKYLLPLFDRDEILQKLGKSSKF